MEQTVEIHIDELVLYGFSPAEAYKVGASVQAELYRLFSEKGIPPSFSKNIRAAELNGENLQRPSSQNTMRTGTLLANSIYSSFSNMGDAKAASGHQKKFSKK